MIIKWNNKMILSFIILFLLMQFCLLSSCYSIVSDLIESKIEQKINQKVSKTYVYNEVRFILNYNFFYGTIFYLDDYKEGFGTIWEYYIYDKDKKNTETFKIERALLKKTKDRLLFKLGYMRKDGDSFYEVLTDYNFNVLDIWVYDIESKKVYHYTYEPPKTKEQTTKKEKDSDEKVLFDKKYFIGKENLKIAGETYNCDYYKIIVKDDSGKTVTYEFWLTNKIPGRIVKYKFIDVADNNYFEALLIEIRYNYKINWSDF
ncbi:MAG: hypothetical protein N3A58_02500 [Spirochaetes bacterium]|nr:hypothetical protein [Spirochaetota bacterium]